MIKRGVGQCKSVIIEAVALKMHVPIEYGFFEGVLDENASEIVAVRCFHFLVGGQQIIGLRRMVVHLKTKVGRFGNRSVEKQFGVGRVGATEAALQIPFVGLAERWVAQLYIRKVLNGFFGRNGLAVNFIIECGCVLNGIDNAWRGAYPVRIVYVGLVALTTSTCLLMVVSC